MVRDRERLGHRPTRPPPSPRTGRRPASVTPGWVHLLLLLLTFLTMTLAGSGFFLNYVSAVGTRRVAVPTVTALLGGLWFSIPALPDSGLPRARALLRVSILPDSGVTPVLRASAVLLDRRHARGRHPHGAAPYAQGAVRRRHRRPHRRIRGPGAAGHLWRVAFLRRQASASRRAQRGHRTRRPAAADAPAAGLLRHLARQDAVRHAPHGLCGVVRAAGDGAQPLPGRPARRRPHRARPVRPRLALRDHRLHPDPAGARRLRLLQLGRVERACWCS